MDSIKSTDMKEKNNKCVPEKTEKASGNQDLQQKSHSTDKHLGRHPGKALGTILKMDKG